MKRKKTKKDEKLKSVKEPKIYFTSSDSEAFRKALNIIRSKNPSSIKTKHENLAKIYMRPMGRTTKTEIAYTLHPPEGEFSQEEIGKTLAYIAHSIRMDIEDIVSGEDIVSLRMCKSGYVRKEKRKPIFAIEAFLIAHYAGLYPPIWALNDIAERFKKWYGRQGKTSLDRFFGVDTYKGETPIFKLDMIRERDESLCLTVFTLRYLFDFTLEEASQMAARRLEETKNWDRTGFNLRLITEDTIKDKYKRIYHKNFKSGEFVEDLSNWSNKKKLEFLKSFPENAFPVEKGKTFDDLKKKLKT